MLLKKFGRIMSLGICVIMMFSFCFAEKYEDKTIMTLEEAIDYAMKNNANIIDLGRMEKDQKDAYEKAQKAYRIWQGKKGYSFDNSAQYLEYHGYTRDIAKLTYDKFIASQNTAKSTVKYSVMKLAYTIDELEKTINCLEETIKKQENDVKVYEVKVNINMATQLDLDTSKTTLKTTKSQLETLKSSLETLKISLKSLMGFDVLKELEVILPENEFVVLEVENLNDEIVKSLDTNDSVLTSKLSYKQKEINNVLATTFQFESEKAMKDAMKAFSDAELRLNNEINATKENLLILYRQIKTNEQEVILAKEDLEQLQQKYVQMKTMYDRNMVTKNDFEAYKIALINAENTYNTAIHNNILLNERWNVALMVGDVLANI